MGEALTALESLRWVEILIAVACVLQTLEFFQLRDFLTSSGLWQWSDIGRNFASSPKFIQAILKFVLQGDGFLVLLICRLAAGISLFFMPHWLGLFVLAVTTLLICLKWRGTFNGGSDSMTLMILMASFMANAFGRQHPKVVSLSLVYIALQLSLSYFRAGLAKIKNPSWLRGDALSAIIKSPVYNPSMIGANVFGAQWMRLVSIMLLAYECAFPLALLNEKICLAFIAFGFLFHLANAYFLGLNRFFWAWLAAYPALYYCSGLLFLR